MCWPEEQFQQLSGLPTGCQSPHGASVSVTWIFAPHWEAPGYLCGFWRGTQSCLIHRPTRKTDRVKKQGVRRGWEGRKGPFPEQLLLTTMACCYCHFLFIHSLIHSLLGLIFKYFLNPIGSGKSTDFRAQTAPELLHLPVKGPKAVFHLSFLTSK